MKKGLLLAATLTLSSYSFVDGLAFSLGAYSWKTEISGGISGETDIGDLDLSLDSFDQSSAYNNVYFATLEHPVPILPNVKISYTDLENTGYNGVYLYPGFSPIDITRGTIDLTHTDITGYYKILDNVVELDLGLTVRVFDGSFQLQFANIGSGAVQNTDIKTELALIYFKTAVNLPLGFKLEAEINAGDDGDQRGIDYTLLAQYRSPIGLGVAGGYRSFNADLKAESSNSLIKDVYTDLTYKGPMFYVFYSF